MISPNHRIRTSAIALTALCGALAVAPATASASVYTITAPIPGVIGEVVPAPKDSQTVRRYALVIGANDTRSRAQAPLRFADDDAARIAELLAELGVEAALLTTFDKDSQAVFGELVAEARSPSRTQVLATHRELKRRMEQAKAAGARVEYLIYYSGHGDVGPDGQGYLTLAGGQQLTRHDLFVELLGTSPADHNHIIVDACRSEEFVLSRGDGWRPDRTETDYSRDVQAYLDRRHLGHFPNTGVVLASSVDQQTHEWERYRGGVFTHELLSGLRGGADINGDGEIEYSELGAFVAAANSGVDDPRARLRVVVRPPRGDERLPLLVHDAVAARRVLFFERGDARRYTVEDHRGVRLADLRRSGEQPGYLRLPPGEVFVYREESAVAAEGERPRLEAKITGSQARMIRANELRYEPTRKATRGALDVAFRDGLFVVPYGVGYYKGYTDREGMLGVKDPDWEVRVWREENGELVQVAEVKQDGATTTPPPAAEGPTQAQCYGDGCDEDWSDDDDDDGDDDWRSYWTRSRFWGALGVGIIFAPTGAESQIRLTDDEQRIDSSDTQPWGGPVRGFDLSWQTFSIHKRKYPTWVVYFRSGYTRGHADFAPRSVGGSFSQGDAQSMTYSAVPLYFGCNLYVFNDFPVRPFVGLGFGFDILTQKYERFAREPVDDVRARIGFELHAGVEARITNYFALRGEIRQLWATKASFEGLPNFANTGFTVITSAAFGFPLSRKNERIRSARKRKHRVEKRPPPQRGGDPSAVQVEVRQGDERVIVESRKPAASAPTPGGTAPAAPGVSDPAASAPAAGASGVTSPGAAPAAGQPTPPSRVAPGPAPAAGATQPTPPARAPATSPAPPR